MCAMDAVQKRNIVLGLINFMQIIAESVYLGLLLISIRFIYNSILKIIAGDGDVIDLLIIGVCIREYLT